MKKLFKHTLLMAILAGSMLTAGCVRRTVSTAPGHTAGTGRPNPTRNGEVIQEETLWIWQGGFWNSEGR